MTPKAESGADERTGSSETDLHAGTGSGPVPDGSTSWDETIRDAVAVANIPTLLMVLVQLTGDLSWIAEPYAVSRTRGMADNDTGGLDPELQAAVREAAAQAIVRWHAGSDAAIANPSPELVTRMLAWSMGDDVPLEYGEFLQDELAVGAGVRAASPPVQAPPGFRAVVIGAGISGIAACVRLQGLGLDVTVLEKSDDLGGVWRDNRYPGAGVDTPSHLYSFSFAPHDWSQYFAGRGEIHAYIQRVADDYRVRERVRFGREVVRVVYDEAETRWHLHTRDADGTTGVEHADLVISCVGAFNPPVVPALPGLGDFEGPAFHTAQWPQDLSLTGKRVALVGNGATAMQVAPAIADQVEKLTIFQRSPQWVQPFEKFQQKVPDAVRLLFRKVPLYRAWYRLRLEWIFHDKLYKSLQRDPDWADCRTAINSINAGHRDYFTSYIREQVGDRTDLLEKVIPDYPPFGKRMLMDNGWFRTLRRPNVDLVTDGIASVLPLGVVTTQGETVDVDVLVFATGFDVVRFISSYEVIGRGGRRLREVWDDTDGRAYLGLSIPGFPNFFTLYGPNTQTGHGGSLIHTVEAQLDYVESLLRQLFARGLTSVECKQDVYEDFARQVDDMHAGMVWSHPAMSTYYRNEKGRVVVISPFRNLDYWHLTRRAELDDYLLGSREVDVTAAAPTSDGSSR